MQELPDAPLDLSDVAAASAAAPARLPLLLLSTPALPGDSLCLRSPSDEPVPRPWRVAAGASLIGLWRRAAGAGARGPRVTARTIATSGVVSAGSYDDDVLAWCKSRAFPLLVGPCILVEFDARRSA